MKHSPQASLESFVCALADGAREPGARAADLSLSARLLHPLLQHLERELGVSTGAVRDLHPDARLPIPPTLELFAHAARALHDEALGLRAGRLTPAGDHGAIDFAISTAASVQASIDVARRYARLFSDGLDVRLDVEADRACVRLETAAPLQRTAADYLASYLHAQRFRRHQRWCGALEWWFPYPRPADALEYERTFAPARLRFSAPCLGYTFPADELTLALAKSDAELHAVLCRHAELLLAELPRTHNITEAVRQAIFDELSRGGATTAQVARRLSLGARTLARRLEDEGTSFAALREDARRRLAEQYVASTQLQFSEIAALVGFSEVATLYRAFRRWTQKTPLEYRREQQQREQLGQRSKAQSTHIPGRADRESLIF
jgi:AraC-like DNA-binding protein